MSRLIVSDSSSDVWNMEGIAYKTAPFHVLVDGADWTDDGAVRMPEFLEAVEKAYSSGKTCTSACPSPDEWLDAFGNAEEIYCITISHNLSGSYNSALVAAGMYEEQYPGRKVYVIDSLATAGRMVLMAEYLKGLLDNGIYGDEAVSRVLEYRDKRTVLLFTLTSIKRLAASGRVNPLLVKAIGILDLRLLGIASSEGTVEVAAKKRGSVNALKGTFGMMLKNGYSGGRVIIDHNQNEADAVSLKALIQEKFGAATRVDINPTYKLCSFYSEKNGYIVGYETG